MWEPVIFKSAVPLYLRHDPHDPTAISLLAKRHYKDLVTQQEEEWFETICTFTGQALDTIFGNVAISGGEPGTMEPVEITLALLHGRYVIDRTANPKVGRRSD